MRIKSITVKNFKTYKETVTVDLSDGLNVIVGLNGSGKSNLLAAIEFLLPDASAHTMANLKTFRHTGVGGTGSPLVYVEAVFDNSNRELDIPTDEVVLRHSFTDKKAEWHINRRGATVSEVKTLLENANLTAVGASSFIVKQGRIQRFATMSDRDRLTLFHEVAGSRAYEEKREDASRTLETAEQKKEHVSTLMTALKSKQSSLQSESAELQAYLEAERRKAALAYALAQKEVESAAAGLEEITSREEQVSTQLETAMSKLHGETETANDLYRKVEEAKEKLDSLESRQGTLRKAASTDEGSVTAVTSELKVVEDALTEAREAVQFAAAEKLQLEEKLGSAERLKEDLEDELQMCRSSVDSATAALEVAEREMMGLEMAIGMETAEERDARLNSLLVSLDSRQKEALREMKEQESAARRATESKTQAEKSVTEARTRLSSLENVDEDMGENTDLSSVRRDIDAANERLVSARQSRSQYLRRLDAAQRTQQENNLFLNMPLNRREGINAARAWARGDDFETLANSSSGGGRNGRGSNKKGSAPPKSGSGPLTPREGYLGMVIEQLSVDEDARLAAEVIAENQLFNLLALSDDVGQALLEACGVWRKAHNLPASVTVLPLNQLEAQSKKRGKRKYPSIAGAQPLVELITPLLSGGGSGGEGLKAFVDQTFGKWMFCKTQSAVDEVIRLGSQGDDHDEDGPSNRHPYTGLCAVTPTGEKHEARGALWAGHAEGRNKRFVLYEAFKAAESEEADARLGITQLEHEISTLETSIAELQERLALNLDVKRRQLFEVTKVKEALSLAEVTLRDATRKLTASNDAYARAKVQYDGTATSILDLRRELMTPMPSSEKEAAAQRAAAVSKAQAKFTELKTVTTEGRKTEQRLLKELAKAGKSLSDVRSRLAVLDGECSPERPGRLEARQQQLELELKVAFHSYKTTKASLEDCQDEVESLRSQIKALSESLAAAEKEVSLADQAAAALKEEALLVRSDEEVLTRRLEDAKNRRTHSGGSSGAAAEFLSKNESQLRHLLQEELKASASLSKVNKRALEQLTRLGDELKELEERDTEMHRGGEAVGEFLDTADRHKVRTVINTIFKINEALQSIFPRLVEGGEAKLSLQRRPAAHQTSDGVAENEEDPSKPALDDKDILGVGVKVRMGEGKAGLASLSALSGGEKAVVAVALILAIQQHVPAPFYLLDEIDAALDSRYRSKVAHGVAEIVRSRGGQFIATTFRPEFVEVASKCFHVANSNRASVVSVVTNAFARDVVMEQPDGAVGLGAVALGLAAGASSRQAGRAVEAADDVSFD